MRINWHDDTKATALSSSTPIPANIGRMHMKLGTNWWAREAWSIGPTIENKKQQPLQFWPLLESAKIHHGTKEATNNIATQPRNTWGHFQRFGRGWKALFLPAPSIIQIIQAFFPSTTCTCADNWNSHLAQWIIHNNIYHWKTASSSRIEWSRP